ncbi:MAG: NPCBM/NEW2 domain-containing protein [Oscillospiraceae bacterium]|nr:NPCBM/NEW2 domain-containing protein [Oscillospiraceae bacterium]
MKRKSRLATFFAGVLSTLLVIGLIVPSLAAGSLTTLNNVLVGGISIVIDGQKLHPTDVNGKTVEPMIYQGTTYLPVRAVSSALGKAVYWDGPTYTVYLGDMNGQLEYPTVMLKDMTSISDNSAKSTNKLTDNYGNTYSSAISNEKGTGGSGKPYVEYLVDMKYSHLKGTLFVPEGTNSNESVFITITADGKTIYTSPKMTKSSKPVAVDVNITGYNDIKVEFSNKDIFYLGNGGTFVLCFADAGFYQ